MSPVALLLGVDGREEGFFITVGFVLWSLKAQVELLL